MNAIKPLLVIVLLIFSLSASEKTPKTYKRFIGTSAFVLVNLIPDQEDPPGFYQLNGGVKLTPKDAISIEAITWKFNKPIGIAKSGKTKEKYPGHVREFGIGGAYQRYLWKGAYSAAHLLPLVTRYSFDNSDKTQNGFKLFLTLRAGYHFELFKKRLFIEPSVAMTSWPINTNVPDSFESKNSQCTMFAFEPGLHLGFQF